MTFDIDANGILTVSAKEKATGKEQRITITASTNLSKSDVERKVQEARQHEAEDQRRRQLIEARNAADSLVYQTEKGLAELGDRVPATDRQSIEETIADLRKAMESEDTAQMETLSERLQQASHAMSQQANAQKQAPPAGNGRGPDGRNEQPGSSVDDEVVEGEFFEV